MSAIPGVYSLPVRKASGLKAKGLPAKVLSSASLQTGKTRRLPMVTHAFVAAVLTIQIALSVSKHDVHAF